MASGGTRLVFPIPPDSFLGKLARDLRNTVGRVRLGIKLFLEYLDKNPTFGDPNDGIRELMFRLVCPLMDFRELTKLYCSITKLHCEDVLLLIFMDDFVIFFRELLHIMHNAGNMDMNTMNTCRNNLKRHLAVCRDTIVGCCQHEWAPLLYFDQPWIKDMSGFDFPVPTVAHSQVEPPNPLPLRPGQQPACLTAIPHRQGQSRMDYSRFIFAALDTTWFALQHPSRNIADFPDLIEPRAFSLLALSFQDYVWERRGAVRQAPPNCSLQTQVVEGFILDTRINLSNLPARDPSLPIPMNADYTIYSDDRRYLPTSNDLLFYDPWDPPQMDGVYRIRHVPAWGEEVLALRGHPPLQSTFANYGNLNIRPPRNQPLLPTAQPNLLAVTGSADTSVTTTLTKGNKSATEKQDLQCTKDSVFQKWKAEKRKALEEEQWKQENLRRQQRPSTPSIGQINVPTRQSGIDTGTTNTLTNVAWGEDVIQRDIAEYNDRMAAQAATQQAQTGQPQQRQQQQQQQRTDSSQTTSSQQPGARPIPAAMQEILDSTGGKKVSLHPLPAHNYHKMVPLVQQMIDMSAGLVVLDDHQISQAMSQSAAAIRPGARGQQQDGARASARQQDDDTRQMISSVQQLIDSRAATDEQNRQIVEHLIAMDDAHPGGRLELDDDRMALARAQTAAAERQRSASMGRRPSGTFVDDGRRSSSGQRKPYGTRASERRRSSSTPKIPSRTGSTTSSESSSTLSSGGPVTPQMRRKSPMITPDSGVGLTPDSARRASQTTVQQTPSGRPSQSAMPDTPSTPAKRPSQSTMQDTPSTPARGASQTRLSHHLSPIPGSPGSMKARSPQSIPSSPGTPPADARPQSPDPKDRAKSKRRGHRQRLRELKKRGASGTPSEASLDNSEQDGATAMQEMDEDVETPDFDGNADAGASARPRSPSARRSITAKASSSQQSVSSPRLSATAIADTPRRSTAKKLFKPPVSGTPSADSGQFPPGWAPRPSGTPYQHAADDQTTKATATAAMAQAADDETSEAPATAAMAQEKKKKKKKSKKSKSGQDSQEASRTPSLTSAQDDDTGTSKTSYIDEMVGIADRFNALTPTPTTDPTQTPPTGPLPGTCSLERLNELKKKAVRLAQEATKAGEEYIRHMGGGRISDFNNENEEYREFMKIVDKSKEAHEELRKAGNEYFGKNKDSQSGRTDSSTPQGSSTDLSKKSKKKKGKKGEITSSEQVEGYQGDASVDELLEFISGGAPPKPTGKGKKGKGKATPSSSETSQAGSRGASASSSTTATPADAPTKKGSKKTKAAPGSSTTDLSGQPPTGSTRVLYQNDWMELFEGQTVYMPGRAMPGASPINISKVEFVAVDCAIEDNDWMVTFVNKAENKTFKLNIAVLLSYWRPFGNPSKQTKKRDS